MTAAAASLPPLLLATRVRGDVGIPGWESPDGAHGPPCGAHLPPPRRKNVKERTFLQPLPNHAGGHRVCTGVPGRVLLMRACWEPWGAGGGWRMCRG
jgi:hypothetical protein